MKHRDSSDNLHTDAPTVSVPTPAETEVSAHDDQHSDHEQAFEWVELVRIAFVALAAAAVWFRVWEPAMKCLISALEKRETVNGSF